MGAVSAQTGSILHSEQDGGTLIKDISMLLSHREKTTFNGIMEVWDTIGISRSPRPFSIPPGTEWWITPCNTCLWWALKGRRLGTSKKSMSIHFTGLHWVVKDSQCYGILLGTWELKPLHSNSLFHIYIFSSIIPCLVFWRAFQFLF